MAARRRGHSGFPIMRGRASRHSLSTSRMRPVNIEFSSVQHVRCFYSIPTREPLGPPIQRTFMRKQDKGITVVIKK